MADGLFKKPKKNSGKRAAYTPNPLLEEIKRYHAKKRFSQNFLINADVLQTVTQSLDLKATDQVIEIGSGTGFLTQCLLEKAGRVTAIEVEQDMQRILKGKFATSEHFHLVEADVLKLDMLTLIEGESVKIVGNLPYSITSPILFKLAGELHDEVYPLRNKIDCLTVMVQKEVADRIVAKPGEKAYNPLSISLQWWFDAVKVCDVPRESFHPAPKVTSAVVKLVPREKPIVEVKDFALLHRVVKAAFHQKRKTLKNTLCHEWVKHGELKEENILAMLDEAGISPGLRAEKLSLEEFGRLTDVFYRNTSQG